MSRSPDAADAPAPPEGRGESDRALLLALSAWAPAGPARADLSGSTPASPQERLTAWLDPAWAHRLLEAASRRSSGPSEPAGALDRLRQGHRAGVRVDPARVHPSWWARALREESPAVRRAVVAAASPSIRPRLQSELLLDNDDLRSERPADQEALAWACALWSERLVGGEPEPQSDPPVIAAMTGYSLPGCYRLCRYAGEIKLSLAGQRQAAWAERFTASAGPEFATIARFDVRATASAFAKMPGRRLAARIGLLTVARLLCDGAPSRVRWALQHWPYPVAKLTRGLMPPDQKRSPVLKHVEAGIFDVARARLEGGRSYRAEAGPAPRNRPTT